jgi:hypothetical protein
MNDAKVCVILLNLHMYSGNHTIALLSRYSMRHTLANIPPTNNTSQLPSLPNFYAVPPTAINPPS